MGGWIPTPLSARTRVALERSRRPGGDYEDEKDWCDLAWEARDREQDARSEALRTQLLVRYGGRLPDTLRTDHRGLPPKN